MSTFGISGIWENPQTTIPGIMAGVVGIAVALGWVNQEHATNLIAVGSTLIIALVGIFYKGSKPCLPPLPVDDYYPK